MTFHPLKHDPAAVTLTTVPSVLRRFIFPGRSSVSTAGRLTTSCSASLKITLRRGEAGESKSNYDTKAKTPVGLIVLLTLPFHQQKPSCTMKSQWLLTRVDWIALHVDILIRNAVYDRWIYCWGEGRFVVATCYLMRNLNIKFGWLGWRQ